MKYLPLANVKVIAASLLFELRIYSFQGSEFVGNALGGASTALESEEWRVKSGDEFRHELVSS